MQIASPTQSKALEKVSAKKEHVKKKIKKSWPKHLVTMLTSVSWGLPSQPLQQGLLGQHSQPLLQLCLLLLQAVNLALQRVVRLLKLSATQKARQHKQRHFRFHAPWATSWPEGACNCNTGALFNSSDNLNAWWGDRWSDWWVGGGVSGVQLFWQT